MYEVDNNTVSLLHFDDGIKDETGKVWTAQNSAAVSTTKSKFGTSSLYLNGSNQYLTITNASDFNFGTADFTIEFWVNGGTQSTSYPVILGNYGSLWPGIYYYDSYESGKLSFTYTGTTAPSSRILVSNNILNGNTWHHVAIVRASTVTSLFVDGVLQGTSTQTYNFDLTTWYLGYDGQQASTYFNGYIDEMRISSIARWTSDFNAKTPTNLTAVASDSKVTLSWNIVDGVIGYNVKRSTTAGGPYTTIASNVTDTSYVDASVTNGTTYYYVVTAVNIYGESSNLNEATATPEGIVLLRITMNDSSEREYQVTSSEADKFITWCNRTVDTGTAYYVFNKVVGSQTSKEYLFFEKIISFEVFKIKA